MWANIKSIIRQGVQTFYDLCIVVYQIQKKKNSANQVFVREEYQHTSENYAHHHVVLAID